MNKSALAVAFAVCQAGVTFAQSCENGVCRLYSTSPLGIVGHAASLKYSADSENERRWYLNPLVDTIAAGRASACADGRFRGLNCDCHDPLQTDQRVRGSRFEAPVPRIVNDLSTIRRRTWPIAGFVNPHQPTSFQWPAGNSYRPVASTPVAVNWNCNLREAAAIAKQSGRPMLIKVSAEWCGYCRRMKRETFADARVVRDISQNFVAVGLDADTNGSIVKQLRITALPTVLVVSPDLRILAREEGFRTAVQMGQLMHRHMQRAQLETGVRIASRQARGRFALQAPDSATSAFISHEVQHVLQNAAAIRNSQEARS